MVINIFNFESKYLNFYVWNKLAGVDNNGRRQKKLDFGLVAFVSASSNGLTDA